MVRPVGAQMHLHEPLHVQPQLGRVQPRGVAFYISCRLKPLAAAADLA